MYDLGPVGCHPEHLDDLAAGGMGDGEDQVGPAHEEAGPPARRRRGRPEQRFADAAVHERPTTERRCTRGHGKRRPSIGEHDARLGGRDLFAEGPDHPQVEAAKIGAGFVHQGDGVDLRAVGSGERPERHLPPAIGESVADLGPEDLATSPLSGGDEKQEAGVEGDGVSRTRVQSS